MAFFYDWSQFLAGQQKKNFDSFLAEYKLG